MEILSRETRRFLNQRGVREAINAAIERGKVDGLYRLRQSDIDAAARRMDHAEALADFDAALAAPHRGETP